MLLSTTWHIYFHIILFLLLSHLVWVRSERSLYSVKDTGNAVGCLLVAVKHEDSKTVQIRNSSSTQFNRGFIRNCTKSQTQEQRNIFKCTIFKNTSLGTVRDVIVVSNDTEFLLNCTAKFSGSKTEYYKTTIKIMPTEDHLTTASVGTRSTWDNYIIFYSIVGVGVLIIIVFPLITWLIRRRRRRKKSRSETITRKNTTCCGLEVNDISREIPVSIDTSARNNYAEETTIYSEPTANCSISIEIPSVHNNVDPYSVTPVSSTGSLDNIRDDITMISSTEATTPSIVDEIVDVPLNSPVYCEAEPCYAYPTFPERNEEESEGFYAYAYSHSANQKNWEYLLDTASSTYDYIDQRPPYYQNVNHGSIIEDHDLTDIEESTVVEEPIKYVQVM